MKLQEASENIGRDNNYSYAFETCKQAYSFIPFSFIHTHLHHLPLKTMKRFERLWPLANCLSQQFAAT